MYRTRLAPSPTGSLHLGNARTFVVNWVLARQQGWKILLRIEDLDGPRVRRGAAEETMDDLRWLGLDWDDGPVWQSKRATLYAEAVERLIRAGVAYPCVCTRGEIETASSAPHAEDGSTVYPGTCRGRFSDLEDARRFASREPAIRLSMHGRRSIDFEDGIQGLQRFDGERQLGDFVIRRNDGTAAYQLAVVVDDADYGVTHVVRGADLLESAARQIVLYEVLGMGGRVPVHFHLPLVVGADGRRLAKRHGDTRLRALREQGVSSARVLALLAQWCGLQCGDTVDLEQFVRDFRLSQVPPEPVIWNASAERFLRDRGGVR